MEYFCALEEQADSLEHLKITKPPHQQTHEPLTEDDLKDFEKLKLVNFPR